MRAQPNQSDTIVTKPTRTTDAEATALALSFAQLLDERQAADIVILDVSGPLVIADYFVVATARNTRHAQAVARELDATMKHSGRLRRNVAGVQEECNWVLLDFNEVVVHLFLDESRSFYALESLWADVPRLPFTPAPPTPAPAAREGSEETDNHHIIRPGGTTDRVEPENDATPARDPKDS